jgi:hypothetical protein
MPTSRRRSREGCQDGLSAVDIAQERMASDLSGSIVIHKRAAGISIADAFFPERKQANKMYVASERKSKSRPYE